MQTIFDVETSALPLEQIEKFMPIFEPSKVLKDPDKIKADIEKKKQDWLDDAALHATTGRILAIGIINDEKLEILHDMEERDMLTKFWARFLISNDSFAGHNIRGFDLPFMIRRSFILGLTHIPNVMEGRYLSKRFIDTMELWACGTRDMISLDTLARALGVGQKTGSGKDFSKLYLNPDTRQQALDYLSKDLELTKKCVEIMA